MPIVTFDDFESGDFTGANWTTIDNWSVVTSPVSEGTYAAEGTSTGDREDLRATLTASAYPEVQFAHYVTDNQFRALEIKDPDHTGAERFTSIRTQDIGNGLEIVVFTGSAQGTGISVSSGQFITIRFLPDFANNQFDIVAFDGGSQIGSAGPFNFYTNGDQIAYLDFYSGSTDYNIDTVEYHDGIPIAPSGLSATTSNDDDINLSWTDNARYESEYRVYRAQSSGSTTVDYTQVATLGANVTSWTDTSLEDGEQYYYRVTAANSTGESTVSNEASATTDVPAPSQPTLGNASAGSVSISWTKSDDSSDGNTEIYRSTDGSLGSVVATLAATDTTHTDSVTEGEQYWYTVRRNTDHASADSPQASIVSTLPTPTNLSVDDVNLDGFDISWTDNATDETNYRVKVDGNTVATLPVNTESYTITGLARGESYTVTVEAVGDDTASPAMINATMPAIPTTRVSPTGWAARLTHSSGIVKRPDIAGDPTINPVVNGRPQVTLSTRRSEEWFNSSWDNADADVYHNGELLSVDKLEARDVSAPSSSLTLQGGYELRKRVQAEYDAEEITQAVEDLITTHTSYTPNVDTPVTNKETDVLMQSGDTTSELSSNHLGNVDPTDPYEITNGSVSLLQSSFTREGEDIDRGTANPILQVGSYSSGDALTIASDTDTGEWDFTLDYSIPAESFAMYVRDDADIDGNVAFEWELDHANGTTYSLGTLNAGVISRNEQWNDVAGGDYNGGYSGPDLSAGNYTLRIKGTSNATGDQAYYVDVVAPLDGRFNYTFDNDNGGSEGYLDGPELYPDAVTVEFDDVTSIKAITAGDVSVVTNDTTGNQALSVSNDQGASWLSASNTTTLDQAFADPGATIRFRVTMSRYGTQTTTPKTGISGQSLDSYELRADLEDIPLVVNRAFDTSLESILTELADTGGFVWSFERDQLGNGSIEWTQPGQRTSTANPRVAEYNVTRRTDQQFKRIIVKGSAGQRVGERVTANHGQIQDLSKDDLLEGKEAVYNPDTGASFERNIDYSIDYQSGKITTLSSGNMVNGNVYAVDYLFRTSGIAERDGATELETKTISIPGLSTDRACELTALTILQKLENPLLEAQATISDVPPGWSVIDEVPAGALPGDTTYQIREIETTPRETRLRLGSRESLSELIEDLRNRVDAVSRLS